MSDESKLKKRFREIEEPIIRGKPPWTKKYIDADDKKYCGRTVKRWLERLLFFMAFYAGYFTLCAICYSVFRTTLSNDHPKWKMKQPGLSLEPCIDGIYICRAYYDPKNRQDINMLTKRLTEFLRRHERPTADYFGPCNTDNLFGYDDGKPCIFLKINRLIGYEPDTYSQRNQFPGAAPQELTTFVESLPRNKRKNRIWLSCKSKGKAKFDYYPKERSFSAEKVVAKSKDDFQDGEFDRIVAVQVSELTANKIVEIRCYMWARNIKIDEEEPHVAGTVDMKIKVKS